VIDRDKLEEDAMIDQKSIPAQAMVSDSEGRFRGEE
jgi:hypothetical protein